MPQFFPFIPGNETGRSAAAADTSSPLLGRFRAVVPGPSSSSPYRYDRNGNGNGSKNKRGSHYTPNNGRDLLLSGARGSVHVGYGALALMAELAEGAEEEEDDDDAWSDCGDNEENEDYRNGKSWVLRALRRSVRVTRRNVKDLWIAPRQSAVRRVIETWWKRWGLLVILPAALAVAWCAIPFPQYPLDPDDLRSHIHHHHHYSAAFADATDPPPNPGRPPSGGDSGHRAPGHGEARVQVNFWFFLFVYYGLYNLTALVWITKVFNLYSLNWWPSWLGFPLTVSLIAVVATAAPVPFYLVPELRFLTVHNTAWISWTFVIMAMPVAIAFGILLAHERHLGLRHSLSETQRIFTSSWWTGETDTLRSARDRHNRRRLALGPGAFGDPDAALLQVATDVGIQGAPGFVQRRRWLPASFVRFMWFCLGLIISLLAYLLGEAYAEIYLRTLPHNSFETIAYVYSWVITVHLLDALTGWIIGASEGERVGSYPLSWVFKLYFMLTYQTYVRALYARLRSPSQFIWLQALSSGFLIVLTPLTMTQTYHRALSVLGLTGQSYGAYQKICTRNVFIRSVAESASMLAFLGSILVLHFGPNRDVYPYFSFDGNDDDGDREPYDFELTFYASVVTWACELVAGFILRGLVRLGFGIDAAAEGRLDLIVWPELLPASVAVMVHVLQNMLFSIIRLQFR
ncbi:hypothetical protein F5X96DRAFT_624822 [Biscogniauxia mediterranea]|nr:hypothetical protein F5X96DRAFT_624822 [Biscogniauxia mediterranea]